MRRIRVVLFAASMAALPALPALGAEDFGSLSSQSRAAAAASSKLGDAPFRAGRDPLPGILMRQEMEARGGPRGACENTTSDVCYDLRDGKVVYRRARNYMPRIDGLTPESISVKRDRVVLKYSF